MMKKIQTLSSMNAQRMTSLEIAEVTGKPHNDVLKAIRKMEQAWEKVCQGKFSLTSRILIQPNGGTREVPCYSLSKTECLYIATKFKDEARAKLVIRWQQLEQERKAYPRPPSRAELAPPSPSPKGRENEAPLMLMTENDILREAEVIIGRSLVSFNQHADGCITAKDIAKAIGIEVKELNSFLTDKKVQRWARGQYRLTPEYEGLGLAQNRLFIYYSKDGKQKERTYLVWTPKGAEMIDKMIFK